METHGLHAKFDGDASGLTSAAKQAGAALGTFKKNVGETTNTMMNFSRVIQDAPYGIMGIANNLNPLVESFQRLKVESGSTKAALSSLVAGLAGPAGIGLAIGVVSSLLVKFGSNLFDSGEEVKELDQNIVELNRTLAASKERVDAVVSAFEQLNTLGSINIEILGQSKILDLEGEYVNTRETVQKLTDERNHLYEVWSKALERFNKDQSEENKKAEEDALKAYHEAAAKQKAFEDKVTVAKQNAERQRVDDQRKAAKEAQDLRDKELKDLAKYAREYAKQMEWLRSQAFRYGKEDYSQVPSLNRPDITGNFMAGEMERMDSTENLGILPSASELNKMIADQQKAAQDAEKVWGDFDTNISAIITNVRNELLVGLGEGLGEVLAGASGIDGIMTSMLTTIGNAMAALGKELIVTSTAIVKFKAATAAAFAGNPALGIAVGVGMVALGSAMKARASQIKTFAQGGIVSSPTMGIFGEYAGAKNNPEIVAPLNKLKSMLGDVGGGDYLPMHRISGDNLLLWYARATAKQRRTR